MADAAHVELAVADDVGGRHRPQAEGSGGVRLKCICNKSRKQDLTDQRRIFKEMEGVILCKKFTISNGRSSHNVVLRPIQS